MSIIHQFKSTDEYIKSLLEESSPKREKHADVCSRKALLFSFLDLDKGF